MVAKKTEASVLLPASGGTLRAGGGRTTVLGATAILATFSTTSSNVMYPWTYGRLGAVLGPLLGLSLQTLMCAIALLVARLAVELRCSTFGELGEAIGGRWGGLLLRGAQAANNALFLPVALVLSADALRQMVLIAMGCDTANAVDDGGACGWFQCNVNSLMLVSLFAWPVLLLARDVGDLSWNSLLSVALILVQSVIICAYPAFNAPTDVVHEPVGLFGPSGAVLWSDVFGAMGTFLYSFCPLFLAIEVAHGMSDPTAITRAILYSYGFNLLNYVPVGLAVVAAWGGRVTDPVTSAMGTGAAAGVCNFILLYSTFLDFAICGAVLNRELQSLYLPAFDRQWSLRNLPTWMLITLPSLLFALVFALFVPKLDSLTGMLTAFCVPSAMLFGPAGLLLWRQHRARARDAALEADTVLALAHAHTRSGQLMLGAGVVLGVAISIAIFSHTLHSIGWETSYNGIYWCQVVAGRR